jgi:hypothetical protein
MKGLDCGTSNFVGARPDGDGIVFTRERDAYYVVVPKTKIHASFLKKGLEANQAKYFEADDGRIVIIGQGAIDYAVTRDDEVSRPMQKGVIVAKDKEAIPIIGKIMGYVLGPPSEEKEVVVYSVPADSVDVKFDVTYHKNTMASELTKLGYEPKPLNEAEALCYANLLDDGLTGVCFSFGAGCVNMCLMHAGEPVVTFSNARSGDFIDDRVAAAFDVSPTVVQKEKESCMNLMSPSNGIQEAISGQYKVMIQYALETLAYDFNKSEKKAKVDRPLPLIVSGGTSMVPGFFKIFKPSVADVGLPFEISEIRKAKDQLHDVARGCLLAAQMLY